MPDNTKKPVEQSAWLKLMLEGQLTRDRVLKTRTEIAADRQRAEQLEARRQALLQRGKDADQP
ncbi:hypothetical protein F0M18_06965 [Pseudohalioglobus sediminis]|uniref:Uncharacterized protein n=1 Tax=Pseudohalioglobus sediminis TaxID=2606449 RepID=A0A5B0X1A4_9GAMM|nr:hypothetical protein [Pseudohalioglobus sediminis]KAA1192408.1 hypothetical protein F0M18_06965 [Pseudohalioglobus sediminis]